MTRSLNFSFISFISLLLFTSLFTVGCTDKAVKKGQECPDPPSQCAPGLTCDPVMSVCQIKCSLSQQCEEGFMCDGAVCFSPSERRSYMRLWYGMTAAPALLALICLLLMVNALVRREGIATFWGLVMSIAIYCAYLAYPESPQKYRSEVGEPKEVSSLILTQIRRGEERVAELSEREDRLREQLMQLIEIKRNLLGSQDQSALKRTQTLISKVTEHITRIEKTAHQLRGQIDTIKVQASVTLEGENKEDARLIEMLKTADEVLVELSE